MNVLKSKEIYRTDTDKRKKVSHESAHYDTTVLCHWNETKTRMYVFNVYMEDTINNVFGGKR